MCDDQGKISECIIWTGATRRGYGRTTFGNYAHRVAWQNKNGQIPKGFIVHHKCKNKLCVNPEHLEAMPHAQHPDSGFGLNRIKTHCKMGHEFTPENTYTYPSGGRACKICRDSWRKKYNEIPL